MVGKCNLIFTSGGTGFYSRDNTPEATLEVIEKRADPLVFYVIQESCKLVPTACLSRAVIGSKGKTLIVNLPGKPKAVKENFEILMRNGILIHALGQLKGTDKHWLKIYTYYLSFIINLNISLKLINIVLFNF